MPFWLASTRDVVVPSAAGFGNLAVREPHDRAQRLAGGRAWQRLQLGAASLGLALQPLMTFRFGHPTGSPALSPRRPVERVVL